VPNSSTSAHPSWGTASNIFQQLRTDSQGNLYLAWSQMTDASQGISQVFLSYLPNGASSWHDPVQISTTGEALFGTLAIVSPGNVDVAYYGTTYPGDSNGAPTSTAWDVDLAKVQGLFSSPSTATANVLPGFHHGPISTQGLNPTAPNGPVDRSLGDFFSMAVDGAGLADIITTTTDTAGNRTLTFVHEDPPPPSPAATPTPLALTVPPPAAPSPGAYDPRSLLNNAAAMPAAPTPTAAPTQDAGSGSAAGGPATSQGSGRSGPKYPDGVGVATPADQGGGGGPAPGPPLWFYGLAGGGATAGRFILRRVRA
jgi:hypothetical protein